MTKCKRTWLTQLANGTAPEQTRGAVHYPDDKGSRSDLAVWSLLLKDESRASATEGLGLPTELLPPLM